MRIENVKMRVMQAELPTLLRRTQIIVYLLVLLFRKNEIIKFAFYGIG